MERYFGINVHCLEHLPDGVLETGPLWANSMFPLEGLNGVVAHGNHSNHDMSKSAVVQYVSSQSAERDLKYVGSAETEKFCMQVEGMM